MKINISLQHQTFCLLSVIYVYYVQRKSFPFFAPYFIFSFSQISFTVYAKQLHILFLNTPFIANIVKQRNEHFQAGPHILVAVPSFLSQSPCWLLEPDTGTVPPTNGQTHLGKAQN